MNKNNNNDFDADDDIGLKSNFWGPIVINSKWYREGTVIVGIKIQRKDLPVWNACCKMLKDKGIYMNSGGGFFMIRNFFNTIRTFFPLTSETGSKAIVFVEDKQKKLHNAYVESIDSDKIREIRNIESNVIRKADRDAQVKIKNITLD